MNTQKHESSKNNYLKMKLEYFKNEVRITF